MAQITDLRTVMAPDGTVMSVGAAYRTAMTPSGLVIADPTIIALPSGPSIPILMNTYRQMRKM